MAPTGAMNRLRMRLHCAAYQRTFSQTFPSSCETLRASTHLHGRSLTLVCLRKNAIYKDPTGTLGERGELLKERDDPASNARDLTRSQEFL